MKKIFVLFLLLMMSCSPAWAMLYLKQSTAVVVSVGPFCDKTDGVTFENGLAGTGANQLESTSSGIMLSKNGGTMAVRHATATASTYDAYGMYKVTLDTTDTNTLGTLRLSFGNNDALPVWCDFMVVAANVWDTLCSTDTINANVTLINDVATTSVTTVNANQGTTQPLNFTGTGASAYVQGDVVDWKNATAPAMTGDAYARLGAPAGASVSADIAAVKSDSGSILTDTAAMDTSTELRTLLTGSDTAVSILTASDNIGINWADVAAPTTTVNLSGTTVKAVTDGVTVSTNNDKTGYALSAAGIQAIWDIATSALTTAGSIGKKLADWVMTTIY